MQRDISNITRDLEKKNTNDIIFRKSKIKTMLEADPDIKEVLGAKEKRPLNKFMDKNHPTEEELEKRKEIEEYNEKIKHEQIVPYLKLNGIQTEVLNFILFDIRDNEVSSFNKVIKTQKIYVYCLVHEADMETEYGITRVDLLSYLVKDLLCWTNEMGMQVKCIADYPDIVDMRYYCRTLQFETTLPNNVNLMNAGGNKYDRFNI